MGQRQIVGFAVHLSDDERYRRLNDAVGALTGEVRAREGAGTELVIDVAELVWEPIAD